MSYNILTTAQKHDLYCHDPAGHVSDWGRVGDVRRCTHGTLQLGYEVRGAVPPYWRDLSPIWTPILWRRASRALADGTS